MKKFLSTLFVFLMVVSMVSCSTKQNATPTIPGTTPIISPTEPAPSAGDSLTGTFILDPNTGNTFAGFEHDDTHVQVGTVSAMTTATGLMNRAVNFSPVDISDYANGYIHFLLYVEDSSGFTSYAYFEISSGGENNINEMSYQLQPIGFTNGWNHFTFKLSSGTSTGGAIDWSAVNWARLVLQNDNGDPVWFAGMYVTQNEKDPIPSVNGGEQSLPEYDKTFIPVLRFGVLSDVHISETNTVQKVHLTKAIAKMYEFSESHPSYTALDALLFVGDCVDRAKTVEYQTFTEVLRSKLKSNTKVVACMGNHEFLLGNALSGEEGDPIERWESYMGTDANYYTSINGFTFIAISGDNGIALGTAGKAVLQAGLESAEASNKPVFLIHHAPLAGTINSGSDTVSKTETKEIKTLLTNYPQTIEFVGHVHRPLNDARNIFQDTFTSIGAGTLQAQSFNDGHVPAEHIPQMMIVEVDAQNRVRVFPYDLKENKIINNEPWTIEDPFDPSTFTYTNARAESSRAPEFSNDAQITLTKVGKDYVDFKFPVLDETDTVLKYLIRAYDEQGVLRRSTLVNAPVHQYTKPETLNASLSKLKPGTTYRLEIIAENTFGKLSAPLTCTFTTQSHSGATLATTAHTGVDANGQTYSENGLIVASVNLGIGEKGGVPCYTTKSSYLLYFQADPEMVDLNADAYKITFRYFDGYNHSFVLRYPQDSTGGQGLTYFMCTNSQTWKTAEFVLDDVNFSLRSAGNIFNVYAGSYATGDIAISEVTLEAIYLPDSAPEDASQWVLNPEEGTMLGAGTQDTEQVLVGNYSSKFSPATAGLMVVSQKFSTPLDLSAYYRSGYLHLDIYVEDASAFDSYAYLELSSSGTYDQNEMQYSFQGLLQDGWNRLSFKLKDGLVTGSIDWSSVNFSRLVLQNNDASPFWINGVYVSMKADSSVHP